ncbi:hypothetical protein [Microbacterium pseudoresistens]|uniref:Glucan phosphoethanolaminetransferase (Alkaline phosphatase superfamily) n=1 Tax=Microbacterium pseudoresistens TaxID=640634 RepID=A0A7Y9EVP0_9MICO|nr:hypothetical protein [Microbacterium pseudoresistens]NYD54827.1 glucan phosphoethanolaminetransferase (alkaline phosphatase superfamily) [Microbacterium pseudoresistens]
MDAPPSEPRSGAPRSELALRIVGGALSLLVGIPFLLLVFVALRGRFAGASADPHGYGMIFGTLLAAVVGLVLALVLPLVFPRGRRIRALAWCLLGYVCVVGALFAILLTA